MLALASPRQRWCRAEGCECDVWLRVSRGDYLGVCGVFYGLRYSVRQRSARQRSLWNDIPNAGDLVWIQAV